MQRSLQDHSGAIDEVVEAGGSAKCLTLRLDGEEAAAWRLADPHAKTVPA
jgi:hypothetical protein